MFDFDRYSKDMADTLLEVLHASGLPTEGVLEGRSKEALKKLQMTIERTSGYVLCIYIILGLQCNCKSSNIVDVHSQQH